MYELPQIRAFLVASQRLRKHLRLSHSASNFWLRVSLPESNSKPGFQIWRVLSLTANAASGMKMYASRYSQYQPQSSAHPKVGAYCPKTGVVEARARSDSEILPFAIQLSGTRSMIIRVFLGVKRAAFDRSWKSWGGFAALAGVLPRRKEKGFL